MVKMSSVGNGVMSLSVCRHELLLYDLLVCVFFFFP